MTPRLRKQGGFALLMVLWWLGLIALIGTRMTASGRAQAVEARAMLDRAVLEAQADGAARRAIVAFASGEWPADSRPHHIREGGRVETVRLTDENGRINPNQAPPGLLASLLLAVGLPADQAARLAAAIVDWHTAGDRKERLGAKSAEYRAAGLPYGPADAPFTSVAQLGLVLGMDPRILALVAPHLSVATEGDVDRAVADDVVRTALARFGRNVLPPGLDIGRLAAVIRIDARVEAPDHAAYEREAVVRFALTADPEAAPVEILAWREVPR